MSFSSDVKQEITMAPVAKGVARPLLCSVFLMRAALHFSASGPYISFQSENAATAKYVYQLLKSEFQADVKLSVLKKMNLKKNNVYCLQVKSQASFILEELTILRSSGLCEVPSWKLIRSDRAARAFLQGAFLAGGSINHPRTSNYHMEISTPNEALAGCVSKLMERFYIPSKVTERKGQYIVYTKAGDKIADFLRLVGATKALLDFEDSRIQRDFYNQITRLDNCEVANEMKSIKAAQEQLEWIEVIEQSKAAVNDKMSRVMEARKANPEASLVELCDAVYAMYGEVISKSGMKHRMRAIRQLAAQIQGEET